MPRKTKKPAFKPPIKPITPKKPRKPVKPKKPRGA